MLLQAPDPGLAAELPCTWIYPAPFQTPFVALSQIQDPVLAAALRRGAPAATPSQPQLGALVPYGSGDDAVQPAPVRAAARREARVIRRGCVTQTDDGCVGPCMCGRLLLVARARRPQARPPGSNPLAT